MAKIFKTVDEVIKYYQNKYLETGVEEDRIIVPGVSLEEIEKLEAMANLRLPATMRDIMQKAQFCDFMGFRPIITIGLCLDILRSYALPPEPPLPFEDPKKTGFLGFAHSMGYIVYMKLDSGAIYALFEDDQEKEEIANSLEQFLCWMATLSEWEDIPKHWQLAEREGYPKDWQQVVKSANEALDQLGIVSGRLFWIRAVANSL